MTIDGRTMGRLCDRMAQTIVCAEDDPNAWNIAARRIAETLSLDVARVEFHPALRSTCFALVREASVQARTAEQIERAIDAWKESV